MPWDNNTGGGGRNNNAAAPGVRRPAAAAVARAAAVHPNLEEILNRGRDRFQGGIPGGRWAIVGGVARARRLLAASTSIYTIDPQEVGVELRFGKPKPELTEPGLHFHLVAGRDRRARQRHGKPDHDRLGRRAAATATTTA